MSDTLVPDMSPEQLRAKLLIAMGDDPADAVSTAIHRVVDAASIEIQRLRAEVERLRGELAKSERAYETAFEGREHAWLQLERITKAFGEDPEDFEISSVASFVECEMARIQAHMVSLRERAVVLPALWSEQLAAEGQIRAIDMLTDWLSAPAGNDTPREPTAEEIDRCHESTELGHTCRVCQAPPIDRPAPEKPEPGDRVTAENIGSAVTVITVYGQTAPYLLADYAAVLWDDDGSISHEPFGELTVQSRPVRPAPEENRDA